MCFILDILDTLEMFGLYGPLLIARTEYHIVGRPVEHNPILHGLVDINVDVDLS